MASRCARVALALVLLGVGGVGIIVWEPIWLWATTQRHYFDGPGVRGWRTEPRTPGKPTPRGVEVVYYVRTGFKCSETVFREGRPPRQSTWGADGRLWWQGEWRGAHTSLFSRTGIDGSLHRNTPTILRTESPWLWSVTDQAEPSMPAWMKDDTKWRAARRARD